MVKMSVQYMYRQYMNSYITTYGHTARSTSPDRLFGLVVKASASGAENPGFESHDGIFPGRVMPVTQKLAHQWLPCQTPGIITSDHGLVGPVSVYCDWVR